MKNKFSQSNFTVIVYLILLLLNTPFFYFDLYSIPGLVTIVSSPFMFIIVMRNKIKVLPIVFLLFFYVFIINLSKFTNIERYSLIDSIYISALFPCLFAAYLISEKEYVIKRVFNLYTYIMILLCIPSIFYYFNIMFNIGLPYDMVALGDRSAMFRNYNNLAIFTDYSIITVGKFNVARLCGLFGEPGALGTIMGVLLVADTVAFPEKKVRKALILAIGFLTFSLFFFVTLILYIIYSLRNISCIRLVQLCILVTIVVTILPSDIKEAFDYFILQRITFSGDTQWFAGDNRLDFGIRFRDYLDTASPYQMFFGNGVKSSVLDAGAQYASFHGILYDAGFIGFLTIIIFYSYFYLYRPFIVRAWPYLLITIMPMLSLYQRGDVTSYYYILAAIVVYHSFKSYKKKANICKRVPRGCLGDYTPKLSIIK